MTVPKHLIGQAPCFAVGDVRESAEYYRDKLGFSYDRIWGEPPSFCMAQRDGLTIMLAEVADPADVRPNTAVASQSHRHDGEEDHTHYLPWDAYIWCDSADELFEEFKSTGATVHYEPRIKSAYEMKEFAIKDLDGYVIAFGQNWPNDR
jgi:predicted lactoylglutathione lyase